MIGPKKFRNHLDIDKHIEGNEERIELIHKITDKNTFLPKPVGYKDIDAAFKEWVSEKIKMADENGFAFPTMSLYTTQRFSEYSQTWKYTDSNGNLLLNFFTVKRDNNPQHGSILGGGWNVPGNKYYFLYRKKVMDDNGTESFLDIKARQPIPVDLSYTLSIFATKFEHLNAFNTFIQDRFKDRQDYIFPNGYAMPMTLEDITDSSQYNINDRQFYSQSCTIKVMAYIFKQDDFIMEEIPMKRKINILSMPQKKHASVEIEDCPSTDSSYYYQTVVLTMTFPKCVSEAKFSIDSDFVLDNVELTNALNNFKVWIDDEMVTDRNKLSFAKNQNLKFKIGRRHINEEAVLKLIGHNPNIVFDENKDNDAIFSDEQNQNDFEYTYSAENNK